MIKEAGPPTIIDPHAEDALDRSGSGEGKEAIVDAVVGIGRKGTGYEQDGVIVNEDLNEPFGLTPSSVSTVT